MCATRLRSLVMSSLLFPSLYLPLAACLLFHNPSPVTRQPRLPVKTTQGRFLISPGYIGNTPHRLIQHLLWSAKIPPAILRLQQHR